jgi:hypothetical protein
VTASGNDPDGVLALAEERTGLDEDDLKAIAAAQAEVFRVCTAAAARELSAHLPAAEQAVTDTEAKLGEARASLAGPQAVADRLQAELDECRAAAEAIQLAADDEHLSVRIRARAERAAVAEEAALLEERLRTALRVTDPLVVAVAAAERALKAARGVLAALSEAIRTPLFSGLGRSTKPYSEWLRLSGAWYGDGSREAESLVMGHLKSTGLGARLQTEAIRAYASGHPDALAVAGNVRHLPDGSTVTTTPDGLSVVTHGAATPQDLASAPPVNTVPGPGMADVIGGVRAGIGWPQPQPRAVTKTAAPRRPEVVPDAIRDLMGWASR